MNDSKQTAAVVAQNRISRTFANLSKVGRKKVLSPYITAGDPSPELTVPIMHSLVAAGSDILELGIPFSDPVAEGPVIQAAMERALAHHVTIHTVLAMVKEFRQSDDKTPIILMGYLNPIEFMGYKEFARAAYEAGVDGIIIVDLPPEEAVELHDYLAAYNIAIIFLLSPTTTQARAENIAKLAKGYIYYVTLKGVTGANHLDVSGAADNIRRFRTVISLPIVAGFGIKTPQQAATMAEVADGIVMGATVISVIAASLDNPAVICEKVAALIKTIRQALD